MAVAVKSLAPTCGDLRQNSVSAFQLDVRTFGTYFLVTLNELCFLSIKFYIILPRKSFCSSFISYLTILHYLN